MLARASAGPGNWQAFGAGVLLVLLTLAAYLPALRGGFIWDDNDHLTENPCVVGPLGLKDIWTTESARICPLVQTTFWLEYRLWGLEPWPYHLVNILLHAASGVVLWRLLRKFPANGAPDAPRLPSAGAWLGAALWALHPVQVESVAWITELKNTQSGMFYLLAMLFFVKWLRAENPARGAEKNYVFAVTFAALAMASKSSTVILPFVLGLCAWWLGGRAMATPGWGIVARLSPFFFLSVASSALAIWTQRLEGAAGAEWARSGAERIATAGDVVWFYLGKLAWPQPLIFIYPRWQIDPAKVASYAGTLAVAALLGFLWWKRKQPRVQPLFVAFAYFLIALLPILGLVNHFFLIYSLVADHFQYLASIGPLALAGLVLWRGFDFVKFEPRMLRYAASALLLAVVVTMSRSHVRVFHDSETLWRDTLPKNPDSWMAENNLGLLMHQRGNFAEEKLHYERSLRLNPGNFDALASLGGILVEEGRVDEALNYLQRALQLQPRYKPAQKNYAAALYTQGRYDEAITLLQALLRQDANDVPVLTNLGLAFAKKERWSDAVDCYEKSVRLDPQNATSHYNLAKLLLKVGRTSDAVARFETVLRLASGQAEVHLELADVFRQLGRTNDAIGHLREALRLKPDLAEARMQLHSMGIGSP